MTDQHAQRIVPLPAAEFSDEVREAVRDGILRDRFDLYFSGAADAPPVPNVLATLAHSPKLATAWLGYFPVLSHESSLDVRIRELAILRTTYRLRASYEWTRHVRLAQRAGFADEEIAAIADGAAVEVWCEPDRIVLAAVDELLDEHHIGDDTWAALSGEFDVAQLIELMFLVGSYSCLAMVFNSAGVRLEPGVPPAPFPEPVASEQPGQR